MSSELFRATLMTLVLWAWLSFSASSPLTENTTAALPTKFFKSSMVTSLSVVPKSKDKKNEIVRSTGNDNKSSGPIGVNFYQLPPSPANLLKPDRFQFYTYNERGDMITKQMTMQEIQTLIAGGGPDHSNAEIHEPQKVEDILTGGKKVMDVVEKVQSVLKSAMGKPSTLTGSYPTVPEKASAEWSNILPAILAGDKYADKVDELHYVEKATSKPTSRPTSGPTSGPTSKPSASAIRNDSFAELSKINVTGITPTDDTTPVKIPAQQVPSTIGSQATTSSYTEKLMIPVPVITAEKKTPIAQYTTQSPIFQKITEIVSLENALDGDYNYNEKKDSVSTATRIVSPTTDASSSLLESTKNNYDAVSLVTSKPSIIEQLVDHGPSLSTQSEMKPVTIISINENKVQPILDDVSKTKPTTLVESNDVQMLVTNEPFTTPPIRSSITFGAGTSKLDTSSPTESSTIVHDPVTRPSDFNATQPLKPLPMELVNSLSSMIDQVSQTISSVLPVSSGFESTIHSEKKPDNGSETRPTSMTHTTKLPVIHEEGTTNMDDTFEEVSQDLSIETTTKIEVDREKISAVASFSKPTNPSETISDSTKLYFTQSTFNSTEGTNEIMDTGNDLVSSTLSSIITTTLSPPRSTVATVDSSNVGSTNSSNSSLNLFKPIAIIDDILQTVPTETSTPLTKTFTLPSTLPRNVSMSTLASALIAGFESFDSNVTQNVVRTTTSYPEQINLTDSTVNLQTSTSPQHENLSTITEATEEHASSSTVKEEDVSTKNLVGSSSSTSQTTDRVTFVTDTSIEYSRSEVESSIASGSTTDSIDATTKEIFTDLGEISTTNEILSVDETTVSSNEDPMTANLEVTTSLYNLQKLDAENSSKVESTESPMADIAPRPDTVSQESSKEDNTMFVKHFDDFTETSSTEDEEIVRSTTMIYEELRLNTSVSSNVADSSEKQHQEEDVQVESSNSTSNVSEDPSLKEKVEQQTNQTVSTSNTVVLNVTEALTVVEESTTISMPVRSSNITGNKNSTTSQSSEDKTISSSSNASNLTEFEKSTSTTEKPSKSPENTLNNSMEVKFLEVPHKSQTSQKFDSNDSISSKTNATIIDSEHTWQRISLHQTTLSSIKRSTTTEKPDTSGSTKLQDANATPEETGSQQTSAVDTESTVSLNASKSIGGLDTTTRNTSADIVNFSRLCNELAFKYWTAANKGLSNGRSLVLSPFGMTSLLAMIFLGARGSTSDQMNEVLGLDNVATFNPHLIFQNVTDAVSLARHQGVANAAFVRELFADKAKVRKLLPFYKEQSQQFYEGLVAEVNFATISDLARRRTNLLIRKQTGGRIKDFVKSNAVPLRSPLAAISANVFQTDCNTSSASATGRDGELYFAVSSAHRLRKLIPVPATVWRSNVLAGYEPSLDATAIALGGVGKLVSTIFLLPGQQGHAAPGDTLDRLEQTVVNGAYRDGTWDKLLNVLIPRTGLELQIPKFSHRSVINATAALKRMGLDQIFSSRADFKGINGIGNRLFLSDVLQMNLFSTCGDENISSGRHHVEIYPASPSLRNSHDDSLNFDEPIVDRVVRAIEIQSNNYRTLSTRGTTTRNAERSEDKPRLKLDQPFLYFVRHNPTGLILHMGRFNPRLL